MNYQQYDLLRHTTTVHREPVCENDLTDRTPRVLLRGYFVDRSDIEVCLEVVRGELGIWIYTIDGPRRARCDKDYVPNKRVYPKHSDFEFCKLLIERGVHIPFLGKSYPEEKDPSTGSYT